MHGEWHTVKETSKDLAIVLARIPTAPGCQHFRSKRGVYSILKNISKYSIQGGKNIPSLD